jgi:hypothetical protein
MLLIKTGESGVDRAYPVPSKPGFCGLAGMQARASIHECEPGARLLTGPNGGHIG